MATCCRCEPSIGGNAWQIGVNYVHASSDDPNDGAVVCVARSRRLGAADRQGAADRGGLPIAPIGKAKGLKQLTFRGQVPIDPRSQDFFKAVIEERMPGSQHAPI